MWFLLEYAIAIYVMTLMVASETIQKIFLWFVHYMQGLALMMLFMNCGLFLQTMYFWITSIEFDMNRSKFAENAMDLASWELIQTLPTIVYLFFVYLFLVDARAFYVA